MLFLECIKKKRLLFVGLLLAVMSPLALASSVKAIALFNDRAMLSVDGSKAKIIRAGSTYKGVKLISSNTSNAVVEINGERKKLKLNSSLVLSKSLGTKASNSYANSVQLFVDEQGFFQSQGEINGKGINFLVDTGANLVVINSRDADRIGLEYLQGEKTFASTASGRSPMYVITANSMAVGGISINNVRMGVIEGSFPEYPLLGMTFLSRLNMTREGSVMTLSRR